MYYVYMMIDNPIEKKWYKRNGKRVSKQAVQNAKNAYVTAKRTGKMGNLRCSIQLKVADRVDSMSLIEFVNMTGMFTYRN